MNFFDNIGKYIQELKNYLECFFEITQSSNVANQEVVLPFDELTKYIFYPKSAEKWKKTQVATTLASEAATTIMMKLKYNRKASSKHLSCIKWK